MNEFILNKYKKIYFKKISQHNLIIMLYLFWYLINCIRFSIHLNIFSMFILLKLMLVSIYKILNRIAEPISFYTNMQLCFKCKNYKITFIIIFV